MSKKGNKSLVFYKKLWFWIIIMFILVLIIVIAVSSGSDNSENNEALIGEWTIYEDTGTNWGNIYEYTFSEGNKVSYFECKEMTLSDDGCMDGNGSWVGTYKLEKNIITLNLKIDQSEENKYTERLNGPSQKLIVDFDQMKICNRDSGINCEDPYKKDADILD